MAAEFGQPIPIVGPKLAVAIATQNWTVAALTLLLAATEILTEEDCHEPFQLQEAKATARRPARKH